MAYENQTYEVILTRMMDRVRATYPDLDDREGSILFNALAPAALELAVVYTELDNVLSESFPGTATRDYLLISCEQMGMDISQFDAYSGTFRGEFNTEVSIGSQWNCDLYNYTVTKYLGVVDGYHSYEMSCDTIGVAPNTVRGSLLPITEAPTALTHAELVECLIEGEDEVSDDEIRELYFSRVKDNVSDGNVATYQQWCNEYDGIGNAKIFPLWNGGNTVKVSILSTSNEVASDTLVENFQNYLDPGSTGMGDGVAPIGSVVTVTTASPKTVNVEATITLKDGYTNADHLTGVINDYFRTISYEKNHVPYMSVGSALLNADGVEGVTNLKLNGGIVDISLADEEIPVLGSVKWTVSN